MITELRYGRALKGSIVHDSGGVKETKRPSIEDGRLVS
jgi:hypothetical protein